MKSNNYIISFILLFLFCYGEAQNRKLDSLWRIYNNQKQDDTSRLRAINDIVYSYTENNPDTAIILAKQELQLAQLSKEKKFEGMALNLIGVSFYTKANYTKALEFYLKSQKIKQEMGDKRGEGISYINIGNFYLTQSNNSKALECFLKAFSLLEQIGDKKFSGNAYTGIGLVYEAKSDYPKALDYYEKALKLREEIGDKRGVGKSFGKIGEIYRKQSNYPKALQNYLKALKIREEMGDKGAVGDCFISIGHIYYTQFNYSKALEYYLKSLKTKQEIGDKQGIMFCYCNIGSVYFSQSNYSKAMEFQLKALAISKEIGDESATSACYDGIGNIYKDLMNYSKSLENYKLALRIKKEIGDKNGVEICYINIGELFNKSENYKSAILYFDSAFQLSKKMGDINSERIIYKNLGIAYSKTGKYKEAYENQVKFKALTDSIFNADNSKQLGDMKTQFEVDKKETELKLKAETQQAVSTEEKKRQQFVIYAVCGVLLIVFVFSIFLYRRFKITQQQKRVIEKQKELVEQQKTIVEEQKHLVEEHQKEIIDSITYAKRLQQAILPSNKEIKNYLPDNFIYYQPKDIVAGDFYWMEHLDNITFIAVADSTGHGVPGAMVSVVCSNALNRAVKEFGFRDTGKILDKTRELVLETFSKSSSDVKDGMDISLLSIDKKKGQICWSGANNQLWYISNNELKEITADKQPIGKTDNPKAFTTNNIQFLQGDTFYLMTDGYPDQFGGPKGKKFKYKQLEEILISNCNQTLDKQREILENSFGKWKGDLEQVDDVTIIGIKI